jgi:hypothetical protein
MSRQAWSALASTKALLTTDTCETLAAGAA